jgi:hypothetical protein
MRNFLPTGRRHLARALRTLAAIPRQAGAFHWPGAASSLVETALAVLRDGGTTFAQAEPLTSALPWQYALDDHVAYHAYRDDQPNPEPYRVVGRSYTERAAMQPVVQYTLQPWELAGQWVVDRPVVVFSNHVTPWREKS